MKTEPEKNGAGTTPRVSRRQVVKHLVAGTVLGGAALHSGARALQQGQQAEVTAADVTSMMKVIGRDVSERDAAGLVSRSNAVRSNLRSVRARAVDYATEPAFVFQPRIPGVELPTGQSAFRLSEKPPPEWDGDPESLAFWKATDLSRLIRARRISCTDLTKMYLERMKRIGPRLLAFVTLTEERALEQAEQLDRELAAGNYRGPLHGIPWGVKDIFASRGYPTTWGHQALENQLFDYDASIIQQLDAAGAVLIAKLATGRLASGDRWFRGQTRNPWNPSQGSSGSSAGPGSATAAGLVAFSIGTETLGSIVSPSIRNGVTGLRPTYGRVSRHGGMALAYTLDKAGPMCRSAEDCALVMAAIHGPDGLDPSVADTPFIWDGDSPPSELRAGFNEAAFGNLPQNNPQRRRLYEEALEAFRRAGVNLRPVRLPTGNAAYRALSRVCLDTECAAAFARHVGDAPPPIDRASARSGSLVPASDYIHAMHLRRKLAEEFAEALDGIDFVVSIPSTGSILTLTNASGHASLITRAGMQGNTPVSMELIGNIDREAEMLRAVSAFESVTEWHQRWPDTSTIPPIGE